MSEICVLRDRGFFNTEKTVGDVYRDGGFAWSRDAARARLDDAVACGELINIGGPSCNAYIAPEQGRLILEERGRKFQARLDQLFGAVYLIRLEAHFADITAVKWSMLIPSYSKNAALECAARELLSFEWLREAGNVHLRDLFVFRLTELQPGASFAFDIIGNRNKRIRFPSHCGSLKEVEAVDLDDADRSMFGLYLLRHGNAPI